MLCPQCGYDVEGRALFCPNCGRTLEQSPQAPTGQVVPPPVSPDDGKQRRGCGRTFAIVGIAILVVVVVAGIAILAISYGMADRNKVELQAAEEHYQKGVEYLNQEELDLAIAEFEHVLTLNPQHEGAAAALARAQQQLEAEPTATTAPKEDSRAAQFNELEAAYAEGDWQAVLDAEQALAQGDPAYRRGDVDRMLFEAYYQIGLQLVAEDRMQEGLRSLDRALALQPDNAKAAQAKHEASLYVTGMSYWEADWLRTIDSLAALYSLDPDYKDVRERLHLAYAKFGDTLYQEEEWCGAVKQYTWALEIKADPKVADQRQQAVVQCEKPSPSPQPTPSETVGTEPSPTTGATSAPTGTFVGQFIKQESVGGDKISIRGKVLTKNGTGISGVSVKVQAWDWSALALTDGSGQYSFDGLSNPVVYTLSLPDLPSVPFDVETKAGELSWVDFRATG